MIHLLHSMGTATQKPIQSLSVSLISYNELGVIIDQT